MPYYILWDIELMPIPPYFYAAGSRVCSIRNKYYSGVIIHTYEPSTSRGKVSNPALATKR